MSDEIINSVPVKRKGRPVGSGKAAGYKKINWTDDKLKLVEQGGELGRSDSDMAATLGISREYWNRIKNHPKSAQDRIAVQAWDKGYATTNLMWQSQIIKAAKKGDIDALKMLANRRNKENDAWAEPIKGAAVTINNNNATVPEPTEAMKLLAKQLADSVGKKLKQADVIDINPTPVQSLPFLENIEVKVDEGKTDV